MSLSQFRLGTYDVCSDFARLGFRTFYFLTFLLPYAIKSVNILFFVFCVQHSIIPHSYVLIYPSRPEPSNARSPDHHVTSRLLHSCRLLVPLLCSASLSSSITPFISSLLHQFTLFPSLPQKVAFMISK